MHADEKTRFKYVVKTLSRTKRKDYENYVINAVWNRINDRTVKPASQWYVKDKTGWHLIDLYFPQINFGVECDEGYHKRNQPADERRELTLIELLSIDREHPYTVFHIDVTKSYDEIEQRIDECAKEITKLVKERRAANDFVEWSETTLSDRFKNEKIVNSSEDIMFPTIASVVNSLMDSHVKSYRQGYFTPKGLSPEYKFWFPQLEIDGQAQAFGWHNILSDDGDIITEYNDDIEHNLPDWEKRSTRDFLEYTRVVFAKVKDPVTSEHAYRFVGVFKLQDVSPKGVRTYQKISNSFDADKHRIA